MAYGYYEQARYILFKEFQVIQVQIMAGIHANLNLLAIFSGRLKVFYGSFAILVKVMRIGACVKFNPVGANPLCGFNQLMVRVYK